MARWLNWPLILLCLSSLHPPPPLFSPLPFSFKRKYEAVRSPFRTAEVFGVPEIIDPRDTRPLLCDWVEMAYLGRLSHADATGKRAYTYRP